MSERTRASDIQDRKVPRAVRHVRYAFDLSYDFQEFLNEHVIDSLVDPIPGGTMRQMSAVATKSYLLDEGEYARGHYKKFADKAESIFHDRRRVYIVPQKDEQNLPIALRDVNRPSGVPSVMIGLRPVDIVSFNALVNALDIPSIREVPELVPYDILQPKDRQNHIQIELRSAVLKPEVDLKRRQDVASMLSQIATRPMTQARYYVQPRGLQTSTMNALVTPRPIDRDLYTTSS